MKQEKKVNSYLRIPILSIIFAVTVILEEVCMRKLRVICEKQRTAEDEDCDWLEYEEEKVGSVFS